MDEAFELMDVLAKEFGRLVIEWIVGIRFVEQINESVNDRIDIEDGPPIFAQNVQADLALQVDVGMINLRLTFDFGRGVGIVWWNVKGELVRGTGPISRIGLYDDLKMGQVVGIWKGDGGDLAAIEFADVYNNEDNNNHNNSEERREGME